ncbi:MAG: DUF177 domain-containing protein [Myxococcales bacterium]|nr:DUF177 domain-containing protein [Myxococcales bacterium]
MKISVDRFSDSPTEETFTLQPSEWRAASGAAEGADGPCATAVFALVGHMMGVDLYLEGTVSTELELTCGRCLSRYRQPVRERFRLVLEPAGDRVPADPEGAAALVRDGVFLAEELESGWFRGSELDLTSYALELIALVQPVQPVCRDDCRGLCPRCGVDRNQDSCDCAEARPGSPFAVLQGLRDELTEGENR